MTIREKQNKTASSKANHILISGELLFPEFDSVANKNNPFNKKKILMTNYFADKFVYFSGNPEHLSLNLIELLFEKHGGNLVSKFSWKEVNLLVLCKGYGQKRLQEVEEKKMLGKCNIEIMTEAVFVSKFLDIDQQLVDDSFSVPILKYKKR